MSGSQLPVRAGAARVAIACADANCTGTIELTERVAQSRHGHRGHSRSKTVVLGRASYTLAAGQHETVTIRLTGAGRHALARARRHRLSATLSATVTGGQPIRRSVVLAQAQRRHRRHR